MAVKAGRLHCCCKGCKRTKHALGVSDLAWIYFQITNPADFRRLAIIGDNVFFCFVLRIHTIPRLADSIREQTKAFSSQSSNAKQSQQQENPPCADSTGRRSPLLKVCYLEATRLDGKIRSIRKIQGDLFIPAPNTSDVTPSHRLRFGDRIHALDYLLHCDPKYLADPSAFWRGRFLIIPSDDNKKVEVIQGRPSAYSASISMWQRENRRQEVDSVRRCGSFCARGTWSLGAPVSAVFGILSLQLVYVSPAGCEDISVKDRVEHD